MNPVHTRLKEFAKVKFGSIRNLEIALGKKGSYFSTYFSKGQTIGGDLLQELNTKYDLSIDWLFTGKGSMLINDNENAEVINSENKEVPILTNRVALELIEELRKAREERQLFRVAEEVAEYKG